MERTNKQPKVIGIIQAPRAGPQQIGLPNLQGRPAHPFTVIYDGPPYFKTIH